MIIRIDLEKLNTKKELLSYFRDNLDEMYGLNYDALIDTLTFVDEKTTIEFCNIECFENLSDLKEVMSIITTDNANITVRYL